MLKKVTRVNVLFNNKNYQIVKSIFITQNLVQVGTQKRDYRYSPFSFKESKIKIFFYFAKVIIGKN